MKRSFGIIAVMLIIAALTVAVSYTIAQDDAASKDAETPQTQPSKDYLNVAYVNMLQVIKEYDEWKIELENLNKQKEDYQRELTQRENEVIEIYKTLQQSAEPNPELFKKWKLEKQQIEYLKKLWEMNLQNQFRKMFKEIYNQVYDAIIEYANDHAYDLVLGVSEREINVGTEAEFLQKVTLRTVIVYPQSNEITQNVINKLNPQKETPEKPANSASEQPADNGTENPENNEAPADGENN